MVRRDKVKEKLSNNAWKDYETIDNILHEAQVECKESYIDKTTVRIYINERIKYINFKKYPHTEMNMYLLSYGNVVRDKMLNEKYFHIKSFKNEVEKRMSNLMLERAKERGVFKKKETKKIPPTTI